MVEDERAAETGDVLEDDEPSLENEIPDDNQFTDSGSADERNAELDRQTRQKVLENNAATEAQLNERATNSAAIARGVASSNTPQDMECTSNGKTYSQLGNTTEYKTCEAINRCIKRAKICEDFHVKYRGSCGSNTNGDCAISIPKCEEDCSLAVSSCEAVAEHVAAAKRLATSRSNLRSCPTEGTTARVEDNQIIYSEFVNGRVVDIATPNGGPIQIATVPQPRKQVNLSGTEPQSDDNTGTTEREEVQDKISRDLGLNIDQETKAPAEAPEVPAPDQTQPATPDSEVTAQKAAPPPPSPYYQPPAPISLPPLVTTQSNGGQFNGAQLGAASEAVGRIKPITTDSGSVSQVSTNSNSPGASVNTNSSAPRPVGAKNVAAIANTPPPPQPIRQLNMASLTGDAPGSDNSPTAPYGPYAKASGTAATSTGNGYVSSVSKGLSLKERYNRIISRLKKQKEGVPKNAEGIAKLVKRGLLSKQEQQDLLLVISRRVQERLAGGRYLASENLKLASGIHSVFETRNFRRLFEQSINVLNEVNLDEMCKHCK